MAVRDFLVPQLAALSSAREMPIFSLMDQLFRLHQEKPDFAYTDLEARLGERDRAILASAVFSPDGAEEVMTEEQAAGFVRLLQMEEADAEERSLRAKLKDAERSGDMDEAFRLMQAVDQLRRAKKQ